MNISESIIRQRLNLIFGLYELNGSAEYVGEPVSILEHSFQTAYLAQKEETLIGENVILKSTKYGTSVDLDGSFNLKNVHNGTYQLQVSILSYNVPIL